MKVYFLDWYDANGRRQTNYYTTKEQCLKNIEILVDNNKDYVFTCLNESDLKGFCNEILHEI